MYNMLDRGLFGNTIARWYNLHDWAVANNRMLGADWNLDKDDRKWFIRSMVPNDPRCAMNLSTKCLPLQYNQWYPHGGGEISPSVDHMLTGRFQVTIHPGIAVWAVLGCRDVGWRQAFRDNQLCINVEGSKAWALLRQYMNENSFDDLLQLIELYPDHSIEFTTLDRCYGTLPHRNAVVWEVRRY